MMRLRTRRPPHSATTAHACAAYPFVADGGLGRTGVYIGRDAFGGAFCFDAFLLYPEVINSTNTMIFGEVGTHKSGLVKVYVPRQILHGKQGFILDVKGEYGPLGEAWGCVPFVLRPGGDQKLNAIDRRLDREGQLSVLRSVSRQVLIRELTPEEDAALRVALDQVNATVTDREPIIPDIVDALLHPSEEMVRGVSATDALELAASCRQAALALQRLCEGDLRGMFDGPTSESIDLDAPLVIIDLSAVRDMAAIGILMTCAGAFLRGVFAERKRIAEETGVPGRQIIFAIEEGWRFMVDIGAAEFLQELWKLCRAWGIQNILVVHRITDLSASGDDGSRAAKLAEGLLSDAEVKIVHRQPPDQREAIIGMLGRSESEAELILGARPGEAMWIVGDHSVLASTRISSLERAIVYNDFRMAKESA
jgi:type IV secretory pathway VirB4 component